MAGGVADGVFLRVGAAAANIAAAVEAVRAGVVEAGREPGSVRFGAVLHTVFVDDEPAALTMAKSMAAGYYEYTPGLFATAGLSWDGAPPEEIKRAQGVWPDFHHARDLLASGRAVGFLPEAAADAFSLWGPARRIARPADFAIEGGAGGVRLRGPAADPGPCVAARPRGRLTARAAREILPAVRADLESE